MAQYGMPREGPLHQAYGNPGQNTSIPSHPNQPQVPMYQQGYPPSPRPVYPPAVQPAPQPPPQVTYHSPRNVYPGTALPPNPRPSSHQVVVRQPQSNFVIQQTPPKQPSSYLAFSIVVCLLLNPLCGCIAFCCSMASRSAAEREEYDGAKRSGKCALGFNITGIVLTILGVGIGLAIYFTIGWGAVLSGVNTALNSFKGADD